MAPSPARRDSKHRPPYNYTVLSGNNSALITDALATRPWWRPTPEGGTFNLWWGGNGQPFDWANGLAPPSSQRARQLVNKMSTHAEICTKKRLALNLRRHARTARLDLSELVPKSYVVTAGKPGFELVAFREEAAAAIKRGDGHLWIVKPGAGNRGRGIVLLDSCKAVEAHLARHRAGSDWVVQKYIERPLLISGRKFDIRQFVLVTHELRVWMYRDSYVRTCSGAYDAANADLAVRRRPRPNLLA